MFQRRNDFNVRDIRVFVFAMRAFCDPSAGRDS